MERLGEALETGPDNVAALEAVRGLIERIILYPLPERGFEIEVVGDIAAMICLGQAGQTGVAPTQNGGQTLLGSPAVSNVFVGSFGKSGCGDRNQLKPNCAAVGWCPLGKFEENIARANAMLCQINSGIA